MEKTIQIDGKQVRLKATAALPLRYKAQFGQDFFADILKMEPLVKKIRDKKREELTADDINDLDLTIFYNLLWVMAKSADKSIPDPITWLDQFDDFPLEEILPAVLELLNRLMASKKKHQPKKRRQRNG